MLRLVSWIANQTFVPACQQLTLTADHSVKSRMAKSMEFMAFETILQKIFWLSSQHPAFLDLEIAIDERGAQFRRRRLDDQRATLPETVQKDGPALQGFPCRHQPCICGTSSGDEVTSDCISGWRITANSTTWRDAIAVACSMTSGMPAVSATSVSQMMSARRF